MKDTILQVVRKFLQVHYRPGAPLLLGFSGGPDSVALLHMLIECRRFFPLEIQLAHIDHGWRKESQVEAEHLRKEAEKLGLPFYLRTLEIPVDSSNLEEKARDERLRFFQEVYQKIGSQALILAHQADDQSETILKRILEGANLLSLGGTQPTATLNGMIVWRPLLDIPKEMLLKWLKERGLEAVDDATNRDPKYLRARMRTQIFPELSSQFGKSVGSNLNRLGKSIQELNNYFDRRLEPYLKRVVRHPKGVFLDLSSLLPIEPFELKVLLKRIFNEQRIVVAHINIEILADLISKNELSRQIAFKKGRITVDSGSIFIEVFKN